MTGKGDATIEVSPERPIVSKKQDRLGRHQFAVRICRALVDSATKKSTGVVVGVAGSWGSGKSSVLNLVAEHLRQAYPETLVVRFNPWLVTDHVSLIGEFFREINGAINTSSKFARGLKKLTRRIGDYADALAPIVEQGVPGGGRALKVATKAAREISEDASSKPLSVERAKLLSELQRKNPSIVVLLDELDRVRDDEIRVVAQLVRSIADFPQVSYLLAYDFERVALALGIDEPRTEHRLAHGRSYLEKIVQYQFDLPISLDDELKQHLVSELEAVASGLNFPANWQGSKQFRQFIDLIIPNPISTPRDIKRLVGNFRVVFGMVQGEVDWLDTLGFQVLQLKAPATARAIREAPGLVVEDAMDMHHSVRAKLFEFKTPMDRLNLLCAPEEKNPTTERILGFLFNKLADPKRSWARAERPYDSITRRRSMLTLLRLGIIPGGVSRETALELVSSSAPEIALKLENAANDGSYSALIDRIEDVFPEPDLSSYERLWLGASKFASPTEPAWLKQYSPRQGNLHALCMLLFRLCAKVDEYRAFAAQSFEQLQQSGDRNVVADTLRMHMFCYGLYNCGPRDSLAKGAFLDPHTVQKLVEAAAHRDKHAFLTSNWIMSLSTFAPLFTMIDVGIWDDTCRSRMAELMAGEPGLDGITLMLFGGNSIVSKGTLNVLVGLENYEKLVQKRRLSPTFATADETLKNSLEKVLADWLPES